MTQSVRRRIRGAFFIAACFTLSAWADVSVNALFSNHMVLQRDANVPVWGTAAAGKTISVEIAGQNHATTTGEDGRWTVLLKPMKAGGPHTMVISGDGRIEVKDVLVGEVWLCAGQSNMEMRVSEARNADAETRASADRMLRHFCVTRNSAPPAPDDELDGSWQVAGPRTTGGFSATAYFFGRHLRKQLNVPIGLINASWGGTRIEAWMSHEALAKVVDRKTCGKEVGRAKKFDLKKEKEKVGEARAEWKARKEAGKKVSVLAPRARSQNYYGALYNGMIAPLIPFRFRGVIWYQGEANTRNYRIASGYRKRLACMIKDWRTRFGHGDFPFFFVQLPNFAGWSREWAPIRESFLKALEIPATGMAVTIDIGEKKNIHPKNKQDVGRRLAISALHVAYKRNLVYSGPIFREMKVIGDEVKLLFNHVGSGLVAKGKELRGFAIAGRKKKFVAASARIEGDAIIVSAEGVETPMAVRYAWENFPTCNLYNKEGLPASPFRTDDWDM